LYVSSFDYFSFLHSILYCRESGWLCLFVILVSAEWHACAVTLGCLFHRGGMPMPDGWGNHAGEVNFFCGDKYMEFFVEKSSSKEYGWVK